MLARLGRGAVAAHAVAVTVDLQDGGVVQEPVEDGGSDGGVFEDLAPGGDASVRGEDDRAVLVVVELAPPRAWRLRESTKCARGGQSLVDDWEVACFPAQGD